MFTGIIEEVGLIESIRSGPASSLLTIRASRVLEGTSDGDSIAVNGVCLTVTSHTARTFTADVMHETLDRSSLGSLYAGDKVNLERALTLNGRLGGHLVSGHIDGTGVISAIKKDDIALWYTISAAPEILRYIVQKGSIAIDGISLTVAGIDTNSFSVSVIPHTAAMTTLSLRRIGEQVNLENDVIAKYVEKLLTVAPAPTKDQSCQNSQNSQGVSNGCRSRSVITEDFLVKNGF